MRDPVPGLDPALGDEEWPPYLRRHLVDPAGYCDELCEGVPPLSVSLFTAGDMKRRHWHHGCWACGTEVISRMAMTYDCVTCDVMAGPPMSSHADKSYDPEFAATHPSPG